jgi:type II secretion system protein G
MNKQTINKSRFERAFTLIELLVVISIIGILIGLSVFGLQGARVSARDAIRKTDLEQIRSGLAMFKSDCNIYPNSVTGNNLNLSVSTTLIGNDSTPSCSSSNQYISKTPLDPLSPTRSYIYDSPDGAGVTYEICASMEQGGSTVTCGGSSSCGGSTCNYKVTNP